MNVEVLRTMINKQFVRIFAFCVRILYGFPCTDLYGFSKKQSGNTDTSFEHSAFNPRFGADSYKFLRPNPTRATPIPFRDHIQEISNATGVAFVRRIRKLFGRTALSFASGATVARTTNAGRIRKIGD